MSVGQEELNLELGLRSEDWEELQMYGLKRF